MKKFLLLMIIIPALSITNVNAQNQFIGKWIGDDGQDVGFVQFDKEGYATLGLGDQIMGGKEFTLRGEKGSMTYKINSSKELFEIDLIVTKLESGKQKKLLCIAQFINDSAIQFAMNFNDLRPVAFTEENSIILKRE